MAGGPFTPAAGGIRVAVRLTPKASRDRVEGLAPEADGGQVLKVSVTAVPEDGKANAALIKLLSKQWRVAKSSIDIVQGATDRRKVLHVSGDPDDLEAQLHEWMAKIK
ncbi:MAG TPA: DUF167 family protein [Candidatus Omnitrophota bacterium]|nr:DUF167 family protein [Candidatus Omnitrophota bacterium]